MKRTEMPIEAEDTTCDVLCECGESHLWVSEYAITRCPVCGRGYKTEFIVWQYEKEEVPDTVSK